MQIFNTVAAAQIRGLLPPASRVSPLERDSCFFTLASGSHPNLSPLLTQATGDAAFREMSTILPLIVFLTDN